MRPEEMRSTVKNILDAGNALRLYFILRDSRTIEGSDEKKEEIFFLREVPIENELTHDEVLKMFRDFLRERIDVDHLEIKELSKAEESVDAIYRYDYKEIPKELKCFWNFPGENEIEMYANDDRLSNVFGYLIRINATENRAIYLFKKHYQIAVIKRKIYKIGKYELSMGGVGLYQVPADGEYLQLNGTAQMMKLGDDVYVLDTRVLDQMSRVKEKVTAEAKVTIDAIEKTGLLQSVDLLKAYVDNFSYARKLARIGKTSPVLAMLGKESEEKKKEEKKKEVIAFTKKSFLQGLFQYTNDGKISFVDEKGRGTKKKAEAFLQLLSDSYLYSELTDMHYESLAKNELKEVQVQEGVQAKPSGRKNEKKATATKVVPQKINGRKIGKNKMKKIGETINE